MAKDKQTTPLEFYGCGVKIVRAFQPGDIVFLETPQPLRAEAMAHITAEFKRMMPGLKVCVLQHGLKIAGREELDPLFDLIHEWRALLEGVPVESPAFEVAQQMDKILSRGQGPA